MISFLITVCNEVDEFQRLVSLLEIRAEFDYEIVVLYDQQNGDSTILKLVENTRCKVVKSNLNKNFARFKNIGNAACTKPWIFQIDADEYPSNILLGYIPHIIETNSDIDLIYVPRINTVEGLTQEHLNRWGWRVNLDTQNECVKSFKEDSEEYLLLKSSGAIINEAKNYTEIPLTVVYNPLVINFPDYQSRIYKNSPTIKWEGAVHEKITGIKLYAMLPAEPAYSLIHPKTIDRQERQNNFYATINV